MPHAALGLTLADVTAHYVASATAGFALKVDAGAVSGDAIQAAISYDFDGNGSFDRVETYAYFATDDVDGWQVYRSSGNLQSEAGVAMQDLVGGTAKVDLWTAIGSHPVKVDLAASALDLPFQFGGGGSGSTPPPTPSGPSGSPPVADPQALAVLQLATSGDAVIAGAGGGRYIGEPHDAFEFRADGLHGRYDGGGAVFSLPLDAGTGAGNGTQLRLNFDFDGNGATDRIETYQYFETNNVSGWEVYSQSRGLTSAAGSYSDFDNGSVTVEIWNAIGNSPVALHEEANVILPYSGWMI